MDDLWYKDAVFYEVHVKAFQDSNDDGVGDFPGLTGRLDYIQDLGVDCLWLLPFYPSPLRDDGYDIADFQDVSPLYGNDGGLRDASSTEAHRRGPPGDRGPRGESHVGPAPLVPGGAVRPRIRRIATTTSGATPTSATGTRASSSWTPRSPTGRGTRSAKAYYWHRFFSHQPDLNYDNPAVQHGDAGRHALLARQGPRRLPLRRRALPLRARGDELREPARRRTSS